MLQMAALALPLIYIVHEPNRQWTIHPGVIFSASKLTGEGILTILLALAGLHPYNPLTGIIFTPR